MKKNFVPFFLILLCSLFPLKLQAADFTVNTAVDTVDSTPGDGTCADSSDLCSLRAAIMEANALAGADTIHLPAGVYPLSLVSTPDENACANGDLDVTDDLIITGEGSGVTIINGNGSFVHERVFHILPPATAFTISGVTIRGGDASTNGSLISKSGGGLSIDGDINISMTDVSVVDNIAVFDGGIASQGTLTIANSAINGNISTQSVGGIGSIKPMTLTDTTVDGNISNSGLFSCGGIGSTSDVTISGGSVSHNTATHLGGAILLTLGAAQKLSLTNVKIDDNEAPEGGGIAFLGTANIENCEIEGNRSTDITSDGGGIFSLPGSTLTVTGGTISNNSSARDGGGIAMDGALTISGNAVMQGNKAARNGGAILTNGDLNLTDTTLQSNQATLGGGGIVNSSTSATSTFTNVKIADNLTGFAGGGMALSGPLIFQKSTLSGNTAGIAGALLSSASCQISESTVSGNQAELSGGGLAIVGGSLTMDQSTVSGNEAITGDGGGLELSATPTTLTNVTVSGNIAAGKGGGGLFSGATTVVNSTFFGNKAATGGSYYNNAGTSSFLNSILAGAVSGGNCGGLAVTSSGHNIDDANTCGFTGTGDLINTDPKLSPLADNGGSTQTCNLASDSPAIDAGTDAGAPMVDQRGVKRPLDGKGTGTAVTDIGAVEFDRCGDGFTDSILGEECDDGNTDNTDACTNTCKNAVCGDGFVEAGVEECDDGNTTDGDGCSSTCTKETAGSTAGGATGGSSGTISSAGGGCSLIR